MSPKLFHFRLGMTPRLGRSPGELLRPLTRSYFLLLFLGMLLLSLLESSSFTVESTLTSPCSRFDLPLSLQCAALTYLDSIPSHNLVLLTDGSVLFPFGKGGSGVLANCFLSGTEATLSKPSMLKFVAEACAILQTLCRSWQQQQICPFSDSCSVLTTLSFLPSFLLPQSLWQIWRKLSSYFSCFFRLRWAPGHSFLPGNDAVDELARWGALLAPSAIPCSLFLLSLDTFFFLGL